MDVNEQNAMLAFLESFSHRKNVSSKKTATLSISAKNKRGKEIIELSQTVWICQREYIIKVLMGC